MDAAVYGARAAYIGGGAVLRQLFSGPTIWHPVAVLWRIVGLCIMIQNAEAFKAYAGFIQMVLYSSLIPMMFLNSGVPNAIKVAKDVLEPMGETVKKGFVLILATLRTWLKSTPYA